MTSITLHLSSISLFRVVPVKGKSGGKLSFRMNDHGSSSCMYPVYQKELEWTVDLMLDRAGTHSIGISTEHLTEVYLQPELI